MATFAIIETGGKQYRVEAGQKIKVEKLPAKTGDSVTFDKVLLVANDDKVEIGTPYLKETIEAKLVAEGRHEKRVIFRYHSKTRYRKKKGHRQHFSEVEISKV